MNIKTVKTVKALGILGMFLLLVIGGLLIIKPFFEQNSDYIGKIREANSQKSIAEEKLNTLKSKEAQLKTYEKSDDNLSKQFPDDSAMPDISAMIEKAAGKHGVKADSITVSVSTPTVTGTGSASDNATTTDTGEKVAAAPDQQSDANMAETPISLEVSGGSVKAINDFITDLQASDRNIVISNVDLGQGNDSATPAKATIEATTYIYRHIDKVGEQKANTTQTEDPNAAKPSNPIDLNPAQSDATANN